MWPPFKNADVRVGAGEQREGVPQLENEGREPEFTRLQTPPWACIVHTKNG